MPLAAMLPPTAFSAQSHGPGPWSRQTAAAAGHRKAQSRPATRARVSDAAVASRAGGYHPEAPYTRLWAQVLDSDW